jgi:hypothetical protein
VFQRNFELSFVYEANPFEDLDSPQLYSKVQFEPHSELHQGYKNPSVTVYRDMLSVCFDIHEYAEVQNV